MCHFKQRSVISKHIFNSVRKNRFNHLTPFKSKSTCYECKKLKAMKKRKVLSSEQQEKIQNEVNEHESNVKNLKMELLQCIKDSETNDTEVFTFELQRPFEMPCLPAEESYDWRQLWFSLVCIYDEQRQKAYMYVWDETVSRRGQEEIASCLMKHIFSVVSKSTKKVILYSKSSRLYRNMKMSLMLKKVCDYQNDSNLKTIEQRFFLEGHDSNDCDKCFDAINKQIKATLINKNVFAPIDWIELISLAKRSEPKFDVINMTENDFFSVNKLMTLVINETHSATGQEIHWKNISSITYTLCEPQNLSVRYLNKESAVYLLSTQDANEFHRTPLIYSSKGGNLISKIKYDDLQKNLSCIPNEHHEFYKSIKFNDSVLDFALASYDSSSEDMDSDEE